MDNNNNNTQTQSNDRKKIFTMIILIATLMIGTTGATYAYFAISATNNNTITGTAATASLTWEVPVTLVYPETANATRPLVPQKSGTNTSNILQNAAITHKCVDDNGNAICRVYKFKVKNASTATVKINGTIQFNKPSTTSVWTNLKWLLMSSSTAVGDPANKKAVSLTGSTLSTTATSFVSNVSLGAGVSSTEYYIVIWIEETDADQSAADKGTFTATISFASSAGGGLTSTITAGATA